jgi:hypothetical protein
MAHRTWTARSPDVGKFTTVTIIFVSYAKRRSKGKIAELALNVAVLRAKQFWLGSETKGETAP